ncbi:MAG: acylneuraminate cytidylyltransferase family protein [Candidatus Marinimicrobia bacterium]|jgi:N-acylneuraminate cytidylyltransferase|nr:acylneuraminate cytidylyltransferase family protein [Candidatus Neomarinimicrobiota bacterium]MDP6936788.1 acylneuraminate cytidylyltransferase family protein [Candidatus Neomarinimicrobiota bacterium]
MSKTYAIIPARGGSKGLANKNIRSFGGKPLLVHSIDYALSSNLVDAVFVSTDDKKIMETAKNAGANIIHRPTELASDTATTESAIHHFIESCDEKPNTIVLLQATSPLRPKGSLDDALNHFHNEKFDSLLSICPTHRFFWRVKKDKTTFAEYDFKNRPRRQDLKPIDMRFMENGSLYIFTREHFENTGNRLGGKIGFVEWPEHFSLEIDTALDFQLSELIFSSLNP